MADQRPPPGRDWVAVILAAGFALALLILVGAVMYDAVRSDTPGLSENATQILTGWGGGVVGVLGGYVGGVTAERRRRTDPPEDE